MVVFSNLQAELLLGCGDDVGEGLGRSVGHRKRIRRGALPAGHEVKIILPD